MHGEMDISGVGEAYFWTMNAPKWWCFEVCSSDLTLYISTPLSLSLIIYHYHDFFSIFQKDERNSAWIEKNEPHPDTSK